MAEQIADHSEGALELPPRRRRVGCWLFVAVALTLAAFLAYGWLTREELAESLVASQLQEMGLDATYTIESIGPDKQVISNVVVGDPDDPDLTIERAELALVVRFPFAGIGRLTLVRPRLYGSYREGKLSFGSLDKLLFDEPSEGPFTFPNMELALSDGRALIETDYGPVGIKAEGSGHLRGGFSGVLAANAPELTLDDCDLRAATLFGRISIDAERPGFSGPVRLQHLECPEAGLSLQDFGLQLDARVDRNLEGVSGELDLASGELGIGGSIVSALSGESRFSWRDDALTANYDLAVEGVETPDLALARFAIDGSARSHEGFERVELEVEVEGDGLRPGPAIDRALRDAARGAASTFAGPMIAQIRAALAREGQGSTLSANASLRKMGDVFSIVVPQARLRGSSGASLLAISRFQYSSSGAPRFAGSFATGGAGLPQISGRMEQRGGSGGEVLRLRMSEYRAGESSLAIPDLTVTQSPDGAIGFAGRAVANGEIPGGEAHNLIVPVRGNWSSQAGLAVWRECTSVSFDRLTLANLTLDRRTLDLCPPTGGAILRSDARGLRVAAGAPSLDLSGRLGSTPIRLRTGALGVAWPGQLTARSVDVTLGSSGGATRFEVSELDARIQSDVRGTFSDADVRLFAVPLDLIGADGEWRFAGGRLELSGGSFRVEDRMQVSRFQPLVARDAVLALEDNRIAASALLREPQSDRAVLDAKIDHDLATGIGGADLTVDGLVFDEGLQPDTLTPLALGVVANVRGVMQGRGRIDWNEEGVTSNGRFSTPDLDFAAAFGPVEGVSGTIEFTDLLGLITAPDQRLHIRSFNPGIEVSDGELIYQIEPDFTLDIKGGEWPFLGGRLTLQPTVVHLAETETRRFTLQLLGVDAAQFVQRMELANMAATGLFDGTVPLVFDENGGRVEQGQLRARPPGGNLSYVGELTYKDLSAIANFAFDALKSLDYREMEILLDGSLTGEIVTRVRFDGIKQGAAAEKNFITRRLASLPIRFNVNIHAPFYKLITTLKAMYDPAYVRDPRELGLLDAAGRPISNPTLNPLPGTEPDELPSEEEPVQPSASGFLP